MKYWRVAALLLSGLLGVSQLASADIITDPIVRVRDAGSGSIPIVGTPFTFNFGNFPTDPDGSGTDCSVDSESVEGVPLPRVSCIFQNLTGHNLSLLEVQFALPGSPGPLAFMADDPDNLFASESIDPTRARFSGGGIPSALCNGVCVGGGFIIDVVGFPEGTAFEMTFDERPAPVPEPASLLLLGTGLAGLVARRRRQQ
jgi:hypothetical protein